MRENATGVAVRGIAALIVAVVVMSAMAVPIISSVASGVYETGENTDYGYRMSIGDASTSLSIEVVDKSTSTYLINGEEVVVDMSEFTTWTRLMLITDSFMIRLIAEGGMDMYGLGTGWYNLGAAGTSVTMADGTATIYIASTGSTYTAGYSMAVYYDPEGDHIITTNTNTVWVDHDATCYAMTLGASYGDAGTGWYILTATCGGDTTTIASKYYSGDEAAWIETGDLTVNINVNETGDLADRIQVIGFSDGVNSAKVTSYIIAPLEYKYLTDSQQTLLTLIDVIPLLIIVMIVVMAAYAIIRISRDE